MKVSELGSVSNLTMSFSNIPLSANNLELYIDTDGNSDFTNATVITGGNLSNGTVTFAGIDLNNGDVFTLGYTRPSPGGVINSLALWLKADVNVYSDSGITQATEGIDNVQEWHDRSFNPVFNGNQPTETSGGNKPSYIQNGVNFNPSLLFGGANDRLRTPANINSNDLRDVAGQLASVYVVGNSTATSDGAFVDHGGDGGDNFIVTSQRAAFGQSSDVNYTTDVSTQFQLINGVRSGNGTLDMYLDGLANGTLTDADITASNSLLYVGINNSATNDLIGNISEIIIYADGHNATQQRMVQSYLALKYGITIDQTIQPNYIASDATTIIWNGVTNASYNNDIAGIGKDNLSALNQKQSKSVNTDALVTIGLGSIEVDNATNANTFAIDKNFLIWGNDDASTDIQTTELPGGAVAEYRLGREWKVAETGSVNNLTIAFNGIASTAYDLELYVDTDGDGDFTNASIITGGTVVDGKATFIGVDLNDGDVFTLGLTSTSPGGVLAGLNLWLRADVGTTPTTTGTLTGWEDLAQSNHASQFGTRPLPSVIDGSSSLFNFNKAVEFTATNQKIGNVTSTTLGTNSYDIFTFTKEGMTGTRFFNIGRNNTTLNGTNWDSPGLYRNNSIAMRRASNGTLVYLNNPGGALSTTIPSIAYHKFTNVSATKGYNGGDTGTVASYGSVGSLMGGYIVGDTRSTGTGGDDAGFTGTVGEFIAYNRNLSVTERRQVDSYLAIKYGLTLDLAVATNNYLASDGITDIIWNSTANAIYNNDIAGIGRDDLSALNQKQSISINSDALVTIGLGSIEATNEANANTFATDKNFLLWGNDDASTALQTTEMPIVGGGKVRLGREWKVAETGAVFNLTVSFSTPTSYAATEMVLYVDTDGDGDFTNATAITGGTTTDGAVTFTGVDLNNNDVFTLGYTLPSPGGVLTDLNLWLKADQGVHPDLVVNGEITGVTGWTVSGNVGLATDMSFNGGNLTPNGIVYQDIATTSGEPYELNFEYRKVGGAGTVRVRVDVIDVGTLTVLATTTATATSTANTLRALAFSAIGVNTQLRFTDTSPSTNSIDIHIDNVLVISPLEASNGEKIPIWEDISIGNHNASQNNGTLQGVLTDGTLNFNPSVSFDGTADYYNLPTGILDNGNTDYSIISVQTQTVTQEAQVLYLGNTSTRRGIHHQLDGGDQFESSWAGVFFGGGDPNPNEPDIYTATYDNTSGKVVRQDGLQVAASAATNLNYLQTANINKLGKFTTVNYFNGDINEVIVYNTKTTTGVELQRIESYLAIKYGITLDQTAPVNYLASDATITWNATTNATYKNDITGIGRDDASALNQKQSKSVNTDALVTIGLGNIETTNEANANIFAADIDFLLWGNDDASTTVINTGVPSGFSEKISRNWFIQETGAIGNTLVQIPNSAVTGFSSTTELVLLVADDAVFTTNVVTVPMVQNGTNWEVLHDFNGTKYFTFAIIAPNDFMRHGKYFQGGTEQKMKF